MSWPRPRRRPLLPRVALLAAVALLCALALEYGLRAVAGVGRRHLVGPPNSSFVRYPDPSALPGVEGPSRIGYDSRGLRGDELTAQRSPRVLCVGGSTTLCDYLDQAETWPARLQALLGPQAWVGNAGKSGLTSRANALQLEGLLPELCDLDLVLCTVGINDLALALQQGQAYDARGLDEPAIRARVLARAFFDRPRRFALWPPGRTAIAALLDRARRARWAKEGAREDDLGENLRERRRVRGAAALVRERLPDLRLPLEEYRRNLGRMLAAAEEHGVRIVFLTQPVIWSGSTPEELAALCWFGWIGREPWDGPEGYYSLGALAEGISAYNALLRQVCAERGVGCIDLAAALPRDTSVFYDDCHFNEAGAARVAERVAAWLETHPR